MIKKRSNHPSCDRANFFAKENIKENYKIIFIFNRIFIEMK